MLNGEYYCGNNTHSVLSGTILTLLMPFNNEYHRIAPQVFEVNDNITKTYTLYSNTEEGIKILADTGSSLIEEPIEEVIVNDEYVSSNTPIGIVVYDLDVKITVEINNYSPPSSVDMRVVNVAVTVPYIGLYTTSNAASIKANGAYNTYFIEKFLKEVQTTFGKVPYLNERYSISKVISYVKDYGNLYGYNLQSYIPTVIEMKSVYSNMVQINKLLTIFGGNTFGTSVTYGATSIQNSSTQMLGVRYNVNNNSFSVVAIDKEGGTSNVKCYFLLNW